MGADSGKRGKTTRLGSGACKFETENSQPSLQGEGEGKEKVSNGRSSYTKELETQDPELFPDRGTRGFQAYTTASWSRERMQKMPTFLSKV